MVAVLTSFYTFNKEAQEHVLEFMKIDLDDPSEPENAIIIKMCDLSFTLFFI